MTIPEKRCQDQAWLAILKPMDAVTAIKERVNIDDLVAEYVTLKRAGRNFKGLCPFHTEKTPSFMVNPERGIYHCFGCNEGGDVLAFVMKMEGLDFRGALELLARKSGIDLAEYGARERGQSQRKEKLATILELATKYYQTCLSRNDHALRYAGTTRGLTKAILTEWRIGYAPTAGDALVKFLEKRGFALADIREAGLIASTGREPRDLFRGRLMLPLMDGQGRVIGFTGRLLEANSQAPKYLNSPQTLLYDKSRHIFGLHLAKEAIRKTNQAVMVEGNMDVVASHQADVRQVVATAGTALTLEQLRQLTRLASAVVLAFDNDQAGLNATLRAITLAQKLPGATLMVAPIVGGKDPDDLIRGNPPAGGPAAWAQLIEQPIYALDWLIGHYEKTFDVSSALGKRQMSAALLPVITALSDAVEQEHYLKKLAELLDVSVAALQRNRPATHTPRRERRAVTSTLRDEQRVLVDTFLALNAHFPETRVSLEGLELTTLDENQQKLWRYLVDHRDAALEPVPRELHSLADFVKIVLFKAEELYGAWSASDRAVEAIDLAQRLGHVNKRKQLEELSHQIEAAETSGDQTTLATLLDTYQRLLAKD